MGFIYGLLLSFVFTGDGVGVGVGVGVVIKSVERYDLVKIKPTESEAEGYSAYDSVAYDPVKTRLSESQALFWYQTVERRAWEQALWLVGSSASFSDSDNIVFTGP